MNHIPFQIDQVKFDAYCHSRGIRRLHLFGSVLRDDFSPSSDIDVLIEFQPGTRIGLSFFKIQEELSEIFGRPVDLHTANDLSKYFRNDVLREARPLYVAA